jgi:shikimate dehydrogenase
MIKACVIGDPIAHSRSPLIHGHWLKQHGILGSYDRVQVTSAELGKFLRNLDAYGYAGCNVTIPHKQAALVHVDHVDDRVERCGALNTIYMSGGKTHATTTDGIGFCANVEDHCPDFSFIGANVVIYGAGGSARPITDELLRRGARKILITNRTQSRADEIATHFGLPVMSANGDVSKYLPKTDILINCTSQGMKGEGTIDLDLTLLPKSAIVADIVYVPLITDFLKNAQDLGLRIVPGLGMLLHQAVPGFESWFGVRPKVTKRLHDLVAKDIDPAFNPVKVIGLTGSIAMGKSEVATAFAAAGIPVFDADQEVHRLYDSAEGAALIGAIAPAAIKDEKVDRQALTALVLDNSELLKRIETVVHAAVRRARNRFLADAASQGHTLVACDIPLLLETGQEKDVDWVVVVSSPPDQQHARAMARPGMTKEKLDMILSRQMPDQEKRKHADHIIENIGSLAALQAMSAALIKVLQNA